MKNKARKFSPARRSLIVRIEYERDYDHEAWQSGGEEPTPQTCPDAFYSYAQAAYPELLPEQKKRKKVPVGLSKTALRKRLSRIGLRGSELRRHLDAFWKRDHVDLQEDGFSYSGQRFMHWNAEDLRVYFGNRIYKAILSNRVTMFVVFDEFGYYATGAVQFMNTIQDMFRQARSFNAKPIMVEQNMKDFITC